MSEKTVMIYGFDQDKIGLIKRTIAPDASDDELRLFLYQCQRTGLDPFARQIIFQKFKSKDGPARMSIITSVDGYRLLADRTAKYAGSDDYRFDEGITEYEHIQEKRGRPITATCTVYKIAKNQRVPFTATVRWEEYYPGDGPRGFMWNKMPYLMLGKCAESLALRKAFPAELSGLYTAEEMEQANDDTAEGQFTEVKPSVKSEIKEIKPSNGEKFPRPVTPEQLAEMIARKADIHRKENHRASKEDRTKLIANLSSLTTGDDEIRHALTEYLCGQKSIKDLDDANVLSLNEWLKARQIDTGEWVIDGMAQKEYKRIVEEVFGNGHGE